MNLLKTPSNLFYFCSLLKNLWHCDSLTINTSLFFGFCLNNPISLKFNATWSHTRLFL